MWDAALFLEAGVPSTHPSIYLKHFEIYVTQPLNSTLFGASDREMNLNGDPCGSDAKKRFTRFTNKVTLVFKFPGSLHRHTAMAEGLAAI
jgi:hypothetical protein